MSRELNPFLRRRLAIACLNAWHVSCDYPGKTGAMLASTKANIINALG
jgi:hypothetical protein